MRGTHPEAGLATVMDEHPEFRSFRSEDGDRSGSSEKVRPAHIAGAAFVLRRLPLSALRPAVDLAVSVLTKRHPELREALSGLGDKAVLIDPTDLPVTFLLRNGPDGLSIRCARAVPVPSPAHASIAGRLEILIGLAEGEIDGDALFFTRDLTVRGDTGVVLTLRNAMERVSLSLVEEIRSIFGPLTTPLLDATAFAGGLLERLDPVLPTLHRAPSAACLAPTIRRDDPNHPRVPTGLDRTRGRSA